MNREEGSGQAPEKARKRVDVVLTEVVYRLKNIHEKLLLDLRWGILWLWLALGIVYVVAGIVIDSKSAAIIIVTIICAALIPALVLTFLLPSLTLRCTLTDHEVIFRTLGIRYRRIRWKDIYSYEVLDGILYLYLEKRYTPYKIPVLEKEALLKELFEYYIIFSHTHGGELAVQQNPKPA